MTPGACQTTGSGDTACAVPWTDDARADAKTRLLEFVTGTPEGANLPYIVRTVFGRDTDMAGSDAQLARRFFESHPELFKTYRRDGYTWVYPRRAAFHLTRRKHRTKTTDGDGATGKATETDPDFAKDRARAMLSKVSTLGSDSLRADMLGELGTELASVADTWNVFERVRGSGPEYLCLPYRNRFNSPSRASDLRASWRRAWRRARRQYDDAVGCDPDDGPEASRQHSGRYGQPDREQEPAVFVVGLRPRIRAVTPGVSPVEPVRSRIHGQRNPAPSRRLLRRPVADAPVEHSGLLGRPGTGPSGGRASSLEAGRGIRHAD